MTDRDRFELEMSPGMEPPSGLGDRVLVGLAVVALVAGALIAVGNVLPDDDVVAQKSPTASSADRTPRPTSTPPVPRVVTLEPADLVPQNVTERSTFTGWIRANEDLVIHASATLDGTEVGVLARGEAAYVDAQGQEETEQGWLFLQYPPVQGWVATTLDGIDRVARFPEPRYPTTGYLYELSAGTGGFVTFASRASEPGSYLQPRPATSADGAVWERSDPAAFGDVELVDVAYGPAGWIAVGTLYGSADLPQTWLWRSTDLVDWDRLGVMSGPEGDYAIKIVASDQGYLLRTGSSNRGDEGYALWASSDALTWTEILDPLVNGTFGWREIIGVADGFYLWDALPGPAYATAAFSTDGRSWTPAAGPGGPNLQMTSLRGQLLAFDSVGSTDPRIWLGSIVDGGVIWVRLTDIEMAFAGSVVAQLVSHDGRAFAFGWDRESQRAMVWTGTAVEWAGDPLPTDFGGIPQLAAAGSTGVVVLGHRPTLRGDNPIFWHLTAHDQWLAEDEPLVAMVPDLSGDACPPLPGDVLEFMTLDRGAATVCFGAAPITFRAYSESCRDCFGSPPGVSEPAWLASPTTNQLYLSPVGSTGGWWTTAVMPPSLELDSSLTARWLELTGHFDDPVAATCRYEPTVDDVQYWGGPQAAIDGCRQTFVVTEIRLVDGP